MAIFIPALPPWVYSFSLRMEPFGPPLLAFKSYVPASWNLKLKQAESGEGMRSNQLVNGSRNNGYLRQTKHERSAFLLRY